MDETTDSKTTAPVLESQAPGETTPSVTPAAPTDAGATAEVLPQSVVTPTPEKKGSPKFSIFIGLLVFVTLAIYSFVGYLYLQNSQLKKEIGEKSSGQLSGTPTATPSPEISLGEVKIVNGDIVEVAQSGETKALVSKGDFPSTGITGFAKVVVSPDEKLICFEAWPPAPEPALYIANVDGSNLSEVSPNRKGCSWTLDSKKIVYVNIPSDTAPVDIFEYDVSKSEETNLTGTSAEEGFIKYYEIKSVAADKIECSYQKTSSAEDGTTTQGTCTIELATGTLTEL